MHTNTLGKITNNRQTTHLNGLYKFLRSKESNILYKLLCNNGILQNFSKHLQMLLPKRHLYLEGVQEWESSHHMFYVPFLAVFIFVTFWWLLLRIGSFDLFIYLSPTFVVS